MYQKPLDFKLWFTGNQIFAQEIFCKKLSDYQDMFRAFPLGIICEDILLWGILWKCFSGANLEWVFANFRWPICILWGWLMLRSIDCSKLWLLLCFFLGKDGWFFREGGGWWDGVGWTNWFYGEGIKNEMIII